MALSIRLFVFAAITDPRRRLVAKELVLAMLADHHVASRLADGWSVDDPILLVATGVLARRAGAARFRNSWMHTCAVRWKTRSRWSG